MGEEVFKQNIHNIVKLQALWRGYTSRKYVTFLRQTKRVSLLLLIGFYRLTVNTLLLTNQKKLFQNIQNTTQVHNEKRDQSTLLKLGQLTKVSGVEDSEMGMEYKFGQMELGMKVNEKI